MTLQPGDTIGDYQILSVLGKGGMGKVFRVRNVISDRVEAMKVVLPDLSSNPDLADRFLREIRVHASLTHPNIAELRAALRVDNRILMILELVEGVSLDERLRQGPIPLSDAISYTAQVLAALGFAHERGIIHRDIKPANIIVRPDGVVKLTDFGIARSSGERMITKTGMALGSLYYMSPEQVTAGPLDARSDLYSVGVTFYEMLTGKRPIEGDSEYSILNGHLMQIPVPPVERNPQLPGWLSEVVLKALAKKPEERYQTAEGFAAALRNQEETVPLRSLPPLDPAQVAAVESRLTAALGPIAKHLVEREAPGCRNLDELQEKLAEQIPDTREREKFLRGAQKTGPITAPTVSLETPVPTWDAETLRAAKQALTPHIGPIAGILVERAARQARTLRDLYEALAAEIPSTRDREAFLNKAPR
ncbi:MAG TPA: serine/threonine-protein kinase [Bryobacteraceae bacterium]|nr:serine/threonine-protein kinase [Bryobacteraceae bacterium]